MPVILVAEQDPTDAQQTASVLRSAGWAVETVESRAAAMRRAAVSKPGLLVVGAHFPEVSQLVAAFARRQGGPGAIVLVPASADRAAVAELGSDSTVAVPFSDEGLRQTVRQHLEESMPAPTPRRSSQQLTSADIFGDVLAEVEAEAEAARRARRARASAARASKDDVERRLEETLSGLLTAGELRKRSASPKPKPPPAKSAEAEVDALLDETLWALDLSPRAGRASGAVVPQPPSPETAAEATPSVPASLPEMPAPPAASFEPALPTPGFEEASESADLGAEPLPDITVPELPVPELEAPEPREAYKLPETGPFPVPVATPPMAGVPEDLGFDTFKTKPLPIVVAGRKFSEAPVETADSPPPGETAGRPFGDYTLLDRVAIGGMAEVWRARRRGVEGFQKTVAIKKILAHLTSSSDFVEMFVDEAKLAAQLNHHNIIQIYDLGKVGDDFFIAMEFVEGKDLRSILATAKERDRPLPAGLSLLIANAVARALDYAHRKRDFDGRDLGLVHRDVSPQNVLISYEGEIKLCDFGIVKAVSKVSNTQMGALKGKLQYMSPEQAWGQAVDARSDIFSLGSVLFELLTGAKLFTGDSEISVLDTVRECRPRSPRELVPGIPPEVERIVLKALAKDPNERYQTAGALEHDIQSTLEQVKPTPGMKDLAAYLEMLYRPYSPPIAQPAPAAAEPSATAEPVVEPPASAGPVIEPPDGVSLEVLPLAETAAAPPKDKRGRGFRQLLAAAILVGVLAAAGFLALRATGPGLPWMDAPGSAPEALQPAASPDSPAGPGAVGSLPASGDSAETDADPAGAGAAADEAGAPGPDALAASGEPAPPPSDEPLPVDLQQLVEEAVSKRKVQIEAELQQDFEARKQRLEKEIARARQEGAPPPDEDKKKDGGGDGGG